MRWKGDFVPFVQALPTGRQVCVRCDLSATKDTTDHKGHNEILHLRGSRKVVER